MPPIEDYKITSYQHSIKDLPDVIINSAQTLKVMFDSRTDNEVKDKHNGLIDWLAANLITLAQVADMIAQAEFEAGAADMLRAVFVQPGTNLFKPECIPAATAEQVLAGAAEDVFVTPKAAKPVYDEAVIKAYPQGTYEDGEDPSVLNVTIEPNKTYEFGSGVLTLNVTLAAPTPGMSNVYTYSFSTGAAEVSHNVNPPAGGQIIWANGEEPAIEPDTCYTISFVYANGKYQGIGVAFN